MAARASVSSSAAGCRFFSDSPPYAAGLPYRSVQRAAAMADSHKSLLQQEAEQDDHADQLHTGVLRIKEQAGLIKRELDDQNIILERLEEDVDKAEGSMSSLNRKMHHHWVGKSRHRPHHTSAAHAYQHSTAALLGRRGLLEQARHARCALHAWRPRAEGPPFLCLPGASTSTIASAVPWHKAGGR